MMIGCLHIMPFPIDSITNGEGHDAPLKYINSTCTVWHFNVQSEQNHACIQGNAIYSRDQKIYN